MTFAAVAALLVRLLLILQVSPPATDAGATATTQVQVHAATQPATQPIQVNVTLPPGDTKPETIVGAIQKTRVGQYISGERELRWNDVVDPVFWFDTVKDLAVAILKFIPRFVGTMVFLFVFWLIYRGIRRMAMGSMKKGEVDSSIRDMLATLIKWCVMGFGIVIACNQLGIPIVAMLTGVSIIGLAVGFAAQETLANFIAGIVIFLDKPFRPGDWIEVEGTFAQVKRVSFRSTRMLNLDGEVIVFPNTYMLSHRVSNHSTNPINRVSVPIGISYKASIDEARRTLLKVCDGDRRIVSHPAPEVVVDNCGESSVNLALRFWISDESAERTIRHEYSERAKRALDEAKIEIPFPHVQLLLEQTPAVEALAKSRAAA
jgi:small conductance mechanosensitive channel